MEQSKKGRMKRSSEAERVGQCQSPFFCNSAIQNSSL